MGIDYRLNPKRDKLNLSRTLILVKDYLYKYKEITTRCWFRMKSHEVERKLHGK